ncbi:MAG: EamA family transporter [Planctomycetaceae bacterium]|nr:EamA family transporter [Planctomycetaceae bacterium]
MKLNSRLTIILSFLVIYVVWGATFFFDKIALRELPPLMLSAIRFLTAGAIMFAAAKLLKMSLAITSKQLFNCIISGSLLVVYGQGVFIWALQYVETGFAALEAAVDPLLVMLIIHSIDRKPLPAKSAVGAALGTLGVVFLASEEAMLFGEESWIHILILFSCILSWSTGSVFAARAELPKNYFVSAAYQMTSSGILLLAGGFAIGEKWVPPADWSSDTLIAIAFLSLLGSVLAFTAFNHLLRNVSTMKVATASYVNPVVALVLGWQFLNEQVTTQTVTAGAALLTGVYLINSQERVDQASLRNGSNGSTGAPAEQSGQ